jgi:hypothetical protein
MAVDLVIKVLNALDDKGILADTAYPGRTMSSITEPMTAVSLERVEYTARRATVLVTVMVPVSMGGGVCEETALQVGQILENIGGVCVQEECRFNGYADAYYVRVLATFHGAAAMNNWDITSDYVIQVGGQILKNAVSFKAEQAVDEVTGTPLSAAVWTFRIVEEFGRGEAPLPPATEPFGVHISRSTGVETYSDCSWIACQIESTSTGLRQVRTGISKTRSEIGIS